MQVVVKSLIFASLVCSITSENDCLRKDIPFEFIQKSALETSYSSESKVRVNCETGYVGFLKLSCENGTWKKDGGRECKKKPCGHPGDTPNGDFELIGDTEFVFGARVEYTCRTGYVMASRVNIRICRTQGWDNTIPICEVVRCPTIVTTGDVIATGNTEEASYDDVINFECASSNLMLDGTKDIHCKEDGTWSAPVPTCKEIECKPPEIQHGTIRGRKPIYKENEVLQYDCVENYKPRQGIPKCLRNGWSITAQCEEINCLLGPTTPGIESTKPEGKNVFKAGQSVHIKCEKNYWLSVSKKYEGLIRCKDNGHWESPTTCEDVSCEIPHAQHVSSPGWYFRGDRKLGISISYWCEDGYKKAAERATCTVDGWSPNPLCVETGCPVPTVANSKQQRNLKSKYNHGESVTIQCLPGYEPERFTIYCKRDDLWDGMRTCTAEQGTEERCDSYSLANGFTHYFTKDSDPTSQWLSYSCDPGYKPNEEGWWGVKSCRQGVLDDKPQCIRTDTCVGLPNIPHARPIKTNKVFKNRDWEYLHCDYGFRGNQDYFECVNGEWDLRARCDRVCGQPPRVENAVIVSGDRPQWHMVTYECRETFAMEGTTTIYCSYNTGWQEAPRCALPSNACGSPTNEINNATIKDTSRVKDYYLQGSNVEYKCPDSFRFKTGRFAHCSVGTWTYPTCTLPSNACKRPTNETNNAVIKDTSKVKDYYLHGNSVEYKCSEGFTFKGGRTARCSQGTWTYPTCTPSLPSNRDDGEEVRQPDRESSTDAPEESLKTLDCGPPPQISDAVQDFKQVYKDGETATYDCPAYYVKDGDPHLTCRRGRWTGSGQCLQPCTVDTYDMDARNILLKTEQWKIYSKHGDYITFKCQQGFIRKGEVAFRQRCLNGNIDLPLCERRQ